MQEGLPARRFLEATDKERNNMFKLIPNVAKGSWVIKQSVGHSPVLLGNKLKTHYFRCDPLASMAHVSVP